MLRSCRVDSLSSSISLTSRCSYPSPSRCILSLLDGVFLNGPFSCRLGSLLLGMRDHSDSLPILTMMERQRCDIAVATSLMDKSSLDETVRENLHFVSERVFGDSPFLENSASEDNVESVMNYVRKLSSLACNVEEQALLPLSLFSWL